MAHGQRQKVVPPQSLSGVRRKTKGHQTHPADRADHQPLPPVPGITCSADYSRRFTPTLAAVCSRQYPGDGQQRDNRNQRSDQADKCKRRKRSIMPTNLRTLNIIILCIAVGLFLAPSVLGRFRTALPVRTASRGHTESSPARVRTFCSCHRFEWSRGTARKATCPAEGASSDGTFAQIGGEEANIRSVGGKPQSEMPDLASTRGGWGGDLNPKKSNEQDWQELEDEWERWSIKALSSCVSETAFITSAIPLPLPGSLLRSFSRECNLQAPAGSPESMRPASHRIFALRGGGEEEEVPDLWQAIGLNLYAGQPASAASRQHALS